MSAVVAPSRFDVIMDLFGQAMDLPKEQQEELLSQTCANDPLMAEEIRQLLANDKGLPPGKLTHDFFASMQGPSRGVHEDLVGTHLGPYKLVSILGRGGAGIVYLGERDDKKYSARVAIKVVDRAATDSRLSSRFTAERQILATLNHGNVARLIDAGESKSNYPYIVMEYVEGQPIDRYCSSKLLTIRERLQLFIRICSGVNYAHRNLIVHSDLKPSNILVTEEGVPKLLDFGIAKLLKPNEPGQALTRMDDRALTPEYSSPEQISGRAVTTASDIYTLGVLLYELLCGISPYKVSSASRSELERAICIVDPARPSSAVTRALLQSESPDYLKIKCAADERQLSVATLSKALSGDLDAIALRALRKEPEKRYLSVEAFVADIQRYLDIEPVQARRGNWFYYSSRYLRRNVVPVSAGAIVVVALAVSSTVTFKLYQEAVAERDNARRIASFMGGVFRDANPNESDGRQVTAVELLNNASSRLYDIGNNDAMRSQLLLQMGNAYLGLGKYSIAADQLRSAASIERNKSDPDRKALAAIIINLANAERGLGDFQAAKRSHDEAIQLLNRTHGDETPEYAELLRAMGILEHNQGELQEAKAHYLASLELSRKSGDSVANIAFTLAQLSALHNWQNDLVGAEQYGREAMTLYQSLPETHPDRIRAQVGFADVLFQSGRIADAANLSEKTVNAQRAIYGNAGPELIKSLTLLSQIRDAEGKGAIAESIMSEVLDKASRDLGPKHYETGFYQTSMGVLLVKHHNYSQALSHFENALAIYDATLPADHQYVASTKHWMGEALLGLHQTDEAAQSFNSALQIWRKGQAPKWLIARTESALGQALLATDRVEAQRYLRDGYTVLNAERGGNDEATRIALQRLGSLNNSEKK